MELGTAPIEVAELTDVKNKHKVIRANVLLIS